MDTTPSAVRVCGTHLSVRTRGTGPAVLLVHGGGEDASMLDGQARSLARAGFHVVTYDRRGTGRSGRDAWPGSGAPQHADDAAALVGALGLVDATVLGVSSGGVVALALAARHPGVAARVVAWEPPALGVVPGARLAQQWLMAPARRHLRARPGDYVGAQAILLTTILGTAVTTDDPAFAAARRNAEAMLRDEPRIPLFRFRADDLAGTDVTIVTGTHPIAPIRWPAARLARWTGRPAVRVEAEHEVHLHDPDVLTGVVVAATGRSER